MFTRLAASLIVTPLGDEERGPGTFALYLGANSTSRSHLEGASPRSCSASRWARHRRYVTRTPRPVRREARSVSSVHARSPILVQSPMTS